MKKNNSKKAWKFIRQTTFTVAKEKQTVTDCSVLNNFFAGITFSNDLPDLTNPSGCDLEDSFTLQPLSVTYVGQLLSSLDQSTSTSPDGNLVIS